MKYISWIYDNPQTAVYDKEVKFECNYVFTFDSYMVNQLRSRGALHVFYMPLAVNVERLRKINPKANDVARHKSDISFIGSLYNEGVDYYSHFITKAGDEHFRGYLEGILTAQTKVYGYNFMAEALSPDILAVFERVGANLLSEGSLLLPAEMYSDVYLSKKLATMNRIELLYVLGNYFGVNFYTYKDPMIPNVKYMGTVRYYDEMPLVFKTAKVNLCDTRRSIKTGIPLRAMDILGCGGFLLSNFQEDYYRHFEQGVHMEMYGSLEEAVEKCSFYLGHESEYSRIRENAYEIMKNEHTYDLRIKEMLRISSESND